MFRNFIALYLCFLVGHCFAIDFKVMTFNTGTTSSKGKSGAKAGEFSEKQAKIADKYYGNGLAWKRAIGATMALI